MANKDYYAILGVQKGVSADELKKAFRRLAHEHHPDKGGNAEKFKDINEAYQVLGDEKKRAAYDRFGSAAFEQGGPGASGFDPAGFQNGFGGFQVNVNDFGDLGDMLGEMFGFGRSSGGRQARHGQDIAVDLALSFKEGVFGVSKDVTLVRPDRCTACKGDGAKPGTKRKACATCGGAGQVRQAQRTLFGMVQVATACPACEGQGQVPEQPCPECRGLGVERREVKVRIDVPPGVNDGDTLRVPGQGEAAPRGGQPGDLYANLRIASDPRFVREGQNLRVEVEVPYTTLALGGSVKIDTIDGDAELSIDPRTPIGTDIVLSGKGIPSRANGRRGDQVVRVTAVVPKKLTREQEAALGTLRSLGL